MGYFTNKRASNPFLKQKKREDQLIQSAMEVNLNLSLLALHQKCGFGQKRAVDDFGVQYGELVDSYINGYLSLEDIRTMNKEYGVEVVQEHGQITIRRCPKQKL